MANSARTALAPNTPEAAPGWSHVAVRIDDYAFTHFPTVSRLTRDTHLPMQRALTANPTRSSSEHHAKYRPSGRALQNASTSLMRFTRAVSAFRCVRATRDSNREASVASCLFSKTRPVHPCAERAGRPTSKSLDVPVRSVPDFAVLATAAGCCAARGADLCVFQGLIALPALLDSRQGVARGHVSVSLRANDSIGATPIGRHEYR